MKLKLARIQLERLPLPPSGQRVYRFMDPPGPLLVVGKRSKTFAFQSDAGGTSRRVAIGRYPYLSTNAARILALDLASQVARGRGIAPNPRLTVEDGMEAYLRDRKGLADKTKRYTRSLFRLYLADWLKKPLASITPRMVLDKHTAIAQQIRKNRRYDSATYDGTATANDVMQACYPPSPSLTSFSAIPILAKLGEQRRQRGNYGYVDNLPPYIPLHDIPYYVRNHSEDNRPRIETDCRYRRQVRKLHVPDLLPQLPRHPHHEAAEDGQERSDSCNRYPPQFCLVLLGFYLL